MTPEKTISYPMLLFALQVDALNVHVALEPHLNVVEVSHIVFYFAVSNYYVSMSPISACKVSMLCHPIPLSYLQLTYFLKMNPVL